MTTGDRTRSGVPAPTTFEVTVPDGTLTVGRFGPESGAPVIVGAHGITANLFNFAPLAAALGDDVTIIAPDLRGRARSRDITGPFSMAHHADDIAAILDHAGVETATMVGHSMGGFVAVVAGDRHPERFDQLVLVDGGLPLDLGPAADLPVDQLIAAVIGPAAERLAMTFESREAYHDFFRVHPALAASWSPFVEAYLDHDLVGEPPELRPSCLIDAMNGDTESQLVRPDIPDAIAKLRHPTLLLHAPRGVMDGDPLYGRDAVARWAAELPMLETIEIPDVNHYTIMLGPAGAGRVADLLRPLLPHPT